MQQLHRPGEAMAAQACHIRRAHLKFACSPGIRQISYGCRQATSLLHPGTSLATPTIAAAAAASQSLHHTVLNAESVPSFHDLFGSQGSVHQHSSGKVKVHVSIVQHVQYGQFLRLVGSAKQLGKWDAGYGPDLKWSDGDKWSIDVALAVGAHEFKFVLVHRSGHVEWEPGSNRILEVAPTAAELQVAGHWGSTQDTEVLELRKQQHRQEVDSLRGDAGAMNGSVRAREASAAAEAAETLKSALKQQRASRKASGGGRDLHPVIDSAAAAAAARAAAAEQHEEIQQLEQAVAAAAADIKRLEALSAAEAEAAAAALAAINANDVATEQAMAGPRAGSPSTSRQRVADVTTRQRAIEQGLAAAVAAASSSGDGAGSAMSSQDHQQLMDMLAGLRQDMTDNMQEVASTMQDVQSELMQVQQQMEVLQAEKASLKQAATPAAADGNTASRPGDKQQLAARLGQLSASVNDVKGAFQVAANEQPWDGKPRASLSNSKSNSGNQQNGTSGSKSVDDSNAGSINLMGDAAALSGLHSAVLSWRQELLTFRQDSLELREEIDSVKDVLEQVEHHVTSSNAAVTHSLQHVEQQLQANTEAVRGVGQVVRDVGDDVSQTLLQRLDELRNELKAEVQSVAGLLQGSPTAAAAGAGSSGQQAAVGAARRAAAAAAAACDEDAAAAVVGLLQSSSVAQYYKGLVYCVMMAAGLWSQGLQEDIKGQPMKLTWQAYLERWDDVSISSWRQQLNRQQQVVQATALGGLNSSTRALPLHLLWSIRELSRHSKEVLHLLQAVCSAEDADVMHHLRPSTDAAACAAVFRRWMQAANQAAAAAATTAK